MTAMRTAFCLAAIVSAPMTLLAETDPLAVWEDVDNPSLLTNALALPPAFTAMGWFEAASFADLAPIMSHTADIAQGTNGFGVFTTSEGAVGAFVRSMDDTNTLFSEGAATGVPQHVALAYSGDAATLYLNGMPSATANFATAEPLGWGGTLWAGLPPGETAAPRFDGAFADFRLYGMALAWREVASIFVAERNAALAADGADAVHIDSDGDEMPDAWEMRHGFNPLDPADAAQDADGDGMSNLGECRRGRNPHVGALAATPGLIYSATEAAP